MAMILRDRETRRQGDTVTWRHGERERNRDRKIQRQGATETKSHMTGKHRSRKTQRQ